MYKCRCGYTADKAKTLRAHVYARRKKDGHNAHGRIEDDSNIAVDESPAVVPAGLITAQEEENSLAADKRIETPKTGAPKAIKGNTSWNTRKVLLVVAAAGLIILAGMCFAVWMSNPRQSMLGLLTAVAGAGGVYLGYSQFRSGSHNEVVAIQGKPIEHHKGPANTIEWRHRRADDGRWVPDGCLFKWVDHPRGTLARITNFNEHMYVVITDENGAVIPYAERLAQLERASGRRVRPEELADYREAEPVSKAINYDPQEWKRFIGPGLLVLVIVVGFICLIAQAG